MHDASVHLAAHDSRIPSNAAISSALANCQKTPPALAASHFQFYSEEFPVVNIADPIASLQNIDSVVL